MCTPSSPAGFPPLSRSSPPIPYLPPGPLTPKSAPRTSAHHPSSRGCRRPFHNWLWLDGKSDSECRYGEVVRLFTPGSAGRGVGMVRVRGVTI
ncbi:hypothetical protein E2C01_001594 [Portunus trituberculatus]|uniref:Uncharacterized protein n=1 Tax=Portunus trituberculatus TaxID=210409 RepID=A0A5B7CI70_PORTR|nr:hypothetical protein [Portunus trituberculatus]